MKRWIRRIAWSLVVLAVLAGIVLATRPKPLPVEVAVAAQGPLRVTVDASGRTRVAERFVVSAPVSGTLERSGLRAGDVVRKGQQLARLTPIDRGPLGPRERAELDARAAAALAATSEAKAAIEAARLALDSARQDQARAERLTASGAAPLQQLEQARIAAEIRGRELEAAEAAARRAQSEARAAQAARGTVGARATGEAVTVASPVDGQVLRVLVESEGPVTAGTALLELGDLAALELVVDVPTTEAVRIRAGAQALVVGWGGSEPLPAKVKLIERGAFTKISALGVEEQRVNVVLEPDGARGAWAVLGDGFRVEARIVVWEADRALKVPLAALSRGREGWQAFVVSQGHVALHAIQIGERNGHEAQVMAGLGEGDWVVLYPGDQIADGIEVVEQRRD